MATLATINDQRAKAGAAMVQAAPGRTAAATNAANQNAGRNTEKFVNPNADLVERMVQTNVNPNQLYYETDQQYRQRTQQQAEGLRLADASLYIKDPTKPTFGSPFVQGYVPPGQDAGVIEQLRTLRQAGMEGRVGPDGKVTATGLNTGVNGEIIGPATPEQIDRNTLNLQGIMNATRSLTPDARRQALDLAARAKASDPDNVTKREYGDTEEALNDRKRTAAQTQAVLLQQVNDLLQRETQRQIREQNTNALGMGPGADQQGQQQAQGGQQSGGMAQPGQQQQPGGATPDFDPTDPAAGMLQGVKDRLTNDRNQILNDIGTTDTASFEQQKADARQAYMDRLDFADEIDEDARVRAEEKQRRALAENQRAQDYSDAQSAEAILDQMKANEEAEVVQRRRINKLSGGHDFSGVKYVAKNLQDGRDAMHFLQLKAGILHGQFSDKAVNIINDYSLDLRQADIDKKTEYRAAYSDYTTKLDDIKADMNKDASEKAKERRDTHRWYSEELTKLDFKHGDNLNALRLKAIDRMNTLDKIRATAENNQISQAMKMLALATKKGVKLSPAAMSAFEKQVAPDLAPGWFTMTTASAGGGAGGTSYKHWTPGGLAAAQQWVQAQPGRSFNDLAPADQEWLVPFNEGSVPGQPQAPTIEGPGLPGQTMPLAQPGFNPFGAIEAQKPSSQPTYIREYDEIVQRTGKAPVDENGKPMSVQQYVGQRSFNFNLQRGGSLQPTTETVVTQPEYDPADDIISSDDADSFDFE